MKKAATILAAILFVCGCDKAPVARISGVIDDLKDSSFVLGKLTFDSLQATDTVKVDKDGKFDCKVTLKSSDPAFYCLYTGDRSLATLILLPGDKINLNFAGADFTVEGSEESALLKEINEEFSSASDRILSGSDRLEAGQAYVQYKRFAVKHIIDNPKSITSAALVFQKFNNVLPVFSEPSDAIIFRQLLDSLETVYPNSEYLVALRDEISSREKILKLNGMLESASSAGFPDLRLPDVEGNFRTLSELKGKVVILSFWSSGMADQKMFNHTLSTLYDKYRSSGLEIYQVALDVDKPAWASVVKSQNLEWISVNDGYGNQSPAVASYNVRKLPTMFIINRDGELCSRDIFEPSKLEAAVKSLL